MPIKQLATVPNDQVEAIKDVASTAEEKLFQFFDLYQELMPQPNEAQARALAFSIGVSGDDNETVAALVNTLVATTARSFEQATGLNRETFQIVASGDEDGNDDLDLDALLSDIELEDDEDTDDGELLEDDAPDDLDSADDADLDSVPLDADDWSTDPASTGPDSDGVDDEPVDPADLTLTSDDLAQLNTMFNETSDARSDIGMDDGETEMSLDGEPGDKPGPDDQAFAFDGEPEALSKDEPFAADDGAPEVE